MHSPQSGHFTALHQVFVSRSYRQSTGALYCGRQRLAARYLSKLGWGQRAFQEKSGGTMKSRISLLLFPFALAMSSTLMAHADVCSNSTIHGNYAFTIHGQ